MAFQFSTVIAAKEFGGDGDLGVVAAGGVDEDGRHAEGFFDGATSAGKAGAVDGVGGKKFGGMACLANGVDARAAAFLVAADDGDAGARRGEALRERAAEHAGRADDNRDFGGQIKKIAHAFVGLRLAWSEPDWKPPQSSATC